MMRHCIAFLLLLAICLGTGLTVAQEAEPDGFEAAMEQGMAARGSGDFETAAARFAEAATLRPEAAEAWLQLGLVQGFAGIHDEALVSFGRGLAVAPDNLDLRLARVRVLAWRGDLDAAESEFVALLESHSDNAEVAALAGRLAYYRGDLARAEAQFLRAAQLDPANAAAQAGLDDVARARAASPGGTYRWTALLEGSRSEFSRASREGWDEGALGLIYAFDDSTRFDARLEVSRRFRLYDAYLRLGVEHDFSPGLRGYLRLGITPDADFLAERTLDAGGALRLREGGDLVGPTWLSADFKGRRYASGDLGNFDPGLQQYFFSGRLWLTGRWINLFDFEADTRLAGWSVRADWQAFDSWRLFAGCAKAPETDRGVAVDTRTRFAGVAVDVTEQVGLTFSVSRENRKNAYIRDTGAASLAVKF